MLSNEDVSKYTIGLMEKLTGAIVHLILDKYKNGERAKDSLEYQTISQEEKVQYQEAMDYLLNNAVELIAHIEMLTTQPDAEYEEVKSAVRENLLKALNDEDV